MRWLLVAALSAVALASWPAHASADAAWTRSYPELEADGCVWCVAVWGDGVYTKVPLQCPAGPISILATLPPVRSCEAP